ncbi:MAG TPA: hypothetical protein VLH15_05010 [Dehalococcoidales bacterium]|nr:hypothetical protein [Dehalococcoidales bacterium]
MDNTKYGQYIVTQLKAPERVMGEYNKLYSTWAKRILWLDKDVVPGAFQINCSWYCRPAQVKTGEAYAHVHDCDEIIGFFGPHHERPYDLGAEIEFWIEDEQHILTSSALIFIPKGIKHCPLILRRVDEPIFHFSTVTGTQYTSIRK